MKKIFAALLMAVGLFALSTAARADEHSSVWTGVDFGPSSEIYGYLGGVTALSGQSIHDQGYELHTHDVHIDLAKDSAVGNQAVAGQGPSGELTAEGIEVFDSGQRVIFLGRTHMLQPSNSESLLFMYRQHKFVAQQRGVCVHLINRHDGTRTEHG